MTSPQAPTGTDGSQPATADEVGILAGTLILRDHLIAVRRRQIGGEREMTLNDLAATIGPLTALATLSHKRADLLIEAHRLVGNAEASAAAARERSARLAAACRPLPSELEDTDGAIDLDGPE
jgi:hypothetical protein